MRALMLAVRGLWWRRGASAAILLVATVCTAVAAAGPAYLAAARDAVTRAGLQEADPTADGTGVTVSRRITRIDNATTAFVQTVRNGFDELIRDNVYRNPIGSIDGTANVTSDPEGAGLRSPIVYRDGVCQHIVLLAGSCVTSADAHGVLLTQSAASTLHAKLGGTVTYAVTPFAKDFALKVRGIYEPRDPGGTFWVNRSNGYFDQTSSTDAVLVPISTWSQAGIRGAATVSQRADVALNPQHVRAGDLPGLVAAVQKAVADSQPANTALGEVTATTNLVQVIERTEQAVSAVAVPIASVAGQLVVLTIAVLFLVMVSSAESRAPEIALGKLHGLRTRAAVVHALLEPFLLLIAAVPLGVLACTAALAAIRPHVFGSVPLDITGEAWLAALAAGLGGVVASLVAATSMLRRPVLEQWQRTERRPARRAWVVEGIVVTAALGGAVELAQRSPSATSADAWPAVAPALIAVAVALIGARVVPLLARTGFGLTRGRRAVALFVALRQLARRRENRRVFGLLCVAVALLVFGLASQVVFDDNRIDRARAEVGADRVLQIDPGASSGPNLTALVNRLDPSGRHAVAVADTLVSFDLAGSLSGDTTSVGTSTVPSVLVADPQRFAAVAQWRSDYGPAKDLRRQVVPLLAPPPAVPTFVGTAVHLVGSGVASAGGSARLHVGLLTSSGQQLELDAGAVPTAASARAIDVVLAMPRCRGGCTLRRLSVLGPASATAPLRADVTITGLSVKDGSGDSTSLLSALRATSWTQLNPADGTYPIDQVNRTATGVEVIVDAHDSPLDDSLGFGAEAGVPVAVPGLVTRSQLGPVLGSAVAIDVGQDSTGTSIPLETTAVRLLPRAGDAGVLVAASWMAAIRPEGSDVLSPNQVWLSADAPADFASRLRAAGVRIDSSETIAGRARVLSRQGPTFAVTMLVLGGVAAAALAVFGALASLFVASRRRLYELAALRALGMSPPRLVASVVLEHAVVCVVAAAVGLLAGLVGTRIALATVPEFSDFPVFPPLIVHIPLARVAGATAAVAVVVIVLAAVGDVLLVRRAAASRLREAQQ